MEADIVLKITDGQGRTCRAYFTGGGDDFQEFPVDGDEAMCAALLAWVDSGRAWGIYGHILERMTSAIELNCALHKHAPKGWAWKIVKGELGELKPIPPGVMT